MTESDNRAYVVMHGLDLTIAIKLNLSLNKTEGRMLKLHAYSQEDMRVAYNQEESFLYVHRSVFGLYRRINNAILATIKSPQDYKTIISKFKKKNAEHKTQLQMYLADLKTHIQRQSVLKKRCPKLWSLTARTYKKFFEEYQKIQVSH